MAREGLVPDLAIVSSGAAPRNLGSRVGRSSGASRRDEPRIYEATAEAILAILRKTAPDVEKLLLVGHNPGFQDWPSSSSAERRSELSRLRAKIPRLALS